ncbi:MAG: type II toxin-antitoxin system VapC family toxin [Thermomicrobiales bacterium]
MILVDTSIWIDHLRRGDPGLMGLLAAESVVMHPWVLGEIALGNLAHRTRALAILRELPSAPVIASWDVIDLIESASLHGLSIGFVDTQLLACAMATPGLTLWTRDARLLRAATSLGCAHHPQSD